MASLRPAQVWTSCCRRTELRAEQRSVLILCSGSVLSVLNISCSWNMLVSCWPPLVPRPRLRYNWSQQKKATSITVTSVGHREQVAFTGQSRYPLYPLLKTVVVVTTGKLRNVNCMKLLHVRCLCLAGQPSTFLNPCFSHLAYEWCNSSGGCVLVICLLFAQQC